MSIPTYLPADIYGNLIDRLSNLAPTAIQPDVRSAVIELLGELANVWPCEVYSGEHEAI